MSAFVESLKRLFAAGKVSAAKIESLRLAEKITDAEAAYILGA